MGLQRVGRDRELASDLDVRESPLQVAKHNLFATTHRLHDRREVGRRTLATVLVEGKEEIQVRRWLQGHDAADAADESVALREKQFDEALGLGKRSRCIERGGALFAIAVKQHMG